MSRIDNLSRGEFEELLRRVKALEVATPLANASAGRGRVRMYDGSELLIQDSNLRVIGTAIISGTLQADGTIRLSGTLTQSGTSTFTGPTNFNGKTTVTGDFDVNGPTKLNGDTRITGKSTLENDLTVTGGGKITAGNVTVDPSQHSGGIVFKNGTHVAQTPNGAQLASGASGGGVTVSPTQADIGIPGGGAVITTGTAVQMGHGSRSVKVDANGVSTTGDTTVNGRLYVVSTGNFQSHIIYPGHPSTTNPANVHISAGNVLYEVTSASRYKVDPQPMDLPDSLLDVPVKDWLDSGEVERGEATRRVPGVIAEEVEAAGGESFVMYEDDGTIQGVAYERYALARTAVLGRKLDAALMRIEELESKIAECA